MGSFFEIVNNDFAKFSQDVALAWGKFRKNTFELAQRSFFLFYKVNEKNQSVFAKKLFSRALIFF